MNYNHNMIIVEIKERKQLMKEKQLIISWWKIKGFIIY